MSRLQVIDPTLHGFTDYTVGATLMTVFPKLAGVTGTQSEKQIRAAGALHAGYSTVTDYPLGAVKLIPYRAHLAIDLAAALGLAALPFVTGQWRKGRRQWLPHVGLALFELASLAASDPHGRGAFHGDVEGIRQRNREDPRGKIEQGGPAVRPTPAAREAAFVS